MWTSARLEVCRAAHPSFDGILRGMIVAEVFRTAIFDLQMEERFVIPALDLSKGWALKYVPRSFKSDNPACVQRAVELNGSVIKYAGSRFKQVKVLDGAIWTM